MIQTRFGTFETNSSSTHSITICSQEEYEAFERGELLFNESWWLRDKTFVTREEAIKALNDDGDYYDDDKADYHYDSEDEWLYDRDFLTYEGYDRRFGEYYEEYVEEYTSVSGDKVVAFGYYGHD